MKSILVNTLLELAHATSQNLDFAHRKDVNVSYGEETITETNLLELRRRHPGVITLRTFGKKTEAKNGADWEWHIIGRARRFGMRVQAKRLQQDNVLKIPHVVKSSKDHQIDLLIKDARAQGLMPVYCFYASETQRQKWRTISNSGTLSPFEFGCLLASAHKVKVKMPKSLAAIESDCVPWHYLADRRRFSRIQQIVINEGSGPATLTSSEGFIQFPVPESELDDNSGNNGFPQIEDLNRTDAAIPPREGIIEGTGDQVYNERSVESFQERGISKLLEIDVRSFPEVPSKP